ncbi:unnamed protein product [Amaranthus hypochondriacus]
MDELNSCSLNYCRICHEAEFESCRNLEAPCACSGTVKFAHRECIQKWCDEKGDIICEICLQKYKPGYTAIPKRHEKVIVQDEIVSIRGSLEVSRIQQQQNPDLLAIAECSSEAEKNASYCKRIALIFTFLLLLRHLLDVLLGAEDHQFSLLTVLILRSCGVIVPMYITIRAISAVQNSIRRHRILHENLMHNTQDEEQPLQTY